MARAYRRKSRELVKSWIEAVNDKGSKLSDWELHFMESITDHFDQDRNLSEKQEEILERLYTEKVR